MKVEAVCTNPGCVSVSEGVRGRQLLSVHRTYADRAYDDDGNLVECPLCGAAAEVCSTAREEAQFPIGSVEPTPAVLSLVAGDVDKALKLNDLVQRHAASDTPLMFTANPGIVYSQVEFEGALLWISTNRTRTQTKIYVSWEDK